MDAITSLLDASFGYFAYDVLPSFLNILRVTEDFLIENNNLEGIKFEEVKDMTVLNEDNYLQ